jgi:hypothetical protein
MASEPKSQTRNTKRLQISLLPADAAEARRIALERTEPGYESNLSGAFRMFLHLYLELEEKGELPEEYQAVPSRKSRQPTPKKAAR